MRLRSVQKKLHVQLSALHVVFNAFMNDAKSCRQIMADHVPSLSSIEAKIFTTLFDLADPSTRTLAISIFSLSRKINIHRNELLRHLEKLEQRRLIAITPGRNFFLDSTFKILSGTEQSRDGNRSFDHQRNQGDSLAKNGKKTYAAPLNVNGTDNGERLTRTKNGNGHRSVKSVKINFIKTVSTDTVTETLTERDKEKNSIAEDSELTANAIARQLNDEKNLALYKAYLKRYPMSVILRAFQDVINTPLHRIKRSPGAYFTFLVKKYGGKK